MAEAETDRGAGGVGTAAKGIRQESRGNDDGTAAAEARTQKGGCARDSEEGWKGVGGERRQMA